MFGEETIQAPLQNELHALEKIWIMFVLTIYLFL
jgi:hypothetical protein